MSPATAKAILVFPFFWSLFFIAMAFQSVGMILTAIGDWLEGLAEEIDG